VPKRIRISPLEDTRGAIRGECHVYEDKGDDGTGNPVYVLEEPRATDAKMPPRFCIARDHFDEWGRLHRPDGMHRLHERDAKFAFPEGFATMVSLEEAESMASQARAEARREAFGEVSKRMRELYKEYFSYSPSRSDYFQLADEYEAAAKAPVEPAKAAGSPNGAGEMS
jgi:hypothetical protein